MTKGKESLGGGDLGICFLQIVEYFKHISYFSILFALCLCVFVWLIIKAKGNPGFLFFSFFLLFCSDVWVSRRFCCILVMGEEDREGTGRF